MDRLLTSPEPQKIIAQTAYLGNRGRFEPVGQDLANELVGHPWLGDGRQCGRGLGHRNSHVSRPGDVGILQPKNC
ncbi:hypothetical protein D3C77_711080 [compost metagenome]